jgi:hypothetical protein
MWRSSTFNGFKNTRKKPRTFLERQYNKSSLKVSCVSSYYRTFAFPLFYPFQKKHPENIGAAAYVFSFAPGETIDGVRVHTGGAPLDFKLNIDHPIFSDFPYDSDRIRWWGGPALLVPETPDRELRIQEFRDNVYNIAFTVDIFNEGIAYPDVLSEPQFFRRVDTRLFYADFIQWEGGK